MSDEQHNSEFHERRAIRDIELMRESLADAIVVALKRVAQDPDFSKSFWRKGFEELSSHSANGASQWVGKRILTALIVAITSAGLVYLARSGKI